MHSHHLLVQPFGVGDCLLEMFRWAAQREEVDGLRDSRYRRVAAESWRSFCHLARENYFNCCSSTFPHYHFLTMHLICFLWEEVDSPDLMGAPLNKKPTLDRRAATSSSTSQTHGYCK